jgi:hypothetical protein
MARYSAFLGRPVEVQYRAGDMCLPASGTFVGDSGRSIFLEQHYEQHGQPKNFRWEIPISASFALKNRNRLLKPNPPLTWKLLKFLLRKDLDCRPTPHTLAELPRSCRFRTVLKPPELILFLQKSLLPHPRVRSFCAESGAALNLCLGETGYPLFLGGHRVATYCRLHRPWPHGAPHGPQSS